MPSNPKIKKVDARMIFDSRGIPTIEADVILDDGNRGSAIAPSGASVGKNEALEKRDKGKKFLGLSVEKNINDIKTKIHSALKGQIVFNQSKIDNILLKLDGKKNKSVLGANTCIAVSMAVLRAAAKSKKKDLWYYLNNSKSAKLPIPQIQIFGGGAHANNMISIQDFLIIPNGAKNFYQAMEWVFKIYRKTYDELKKKNLLMGVADEGGFWPCFKEAEDILKFLSKIITQCGLRLLVDVSIALDVAANNFKKKSGYNFFKNKIISAEELLYILNTWMKKYPIISIEDPFSEDDIKYYEKLKIASPDYVQIIGDDLVVTNKNLILKAFQRNSINSVLIKPNQIGTITETYQAFKLSKDLGLVNIISARSGETEDTIIAELSVGWQANQIKVGSFSRSERLIKWNQCLRIGEKLKNPYLMQKNYALKWDKL
ncbi:MAG: Enolase [Alphaproteobacteria bacterium MarineAlpha9_Bin4]|nr:phosphopyruvate hydratase [Pelagibacterales bacterium]PPR25397.1 MAG: Enolase [Alphaproteobacteria bacterium MarineAlpha9_Bin4]